MLLDRETLFSDAQDLAPGLSDHVLRVQRGIGDYGIGDDVSLFVHVSDVTTAADLTVTLQMSETESMTAPKALGIWTVPADIVGQGGVVLATRVPAGAVGQYLRLAYAGVTGGVVNAGLVKDVPGGVWPY